MKLFNLILQSAFLYNPKTMPMDLATAHSELDKAVEQCYGVEYNSDEKKIIAFLFELYRQVRTDAIL